MNNAVGGRLGTVAWLTGAGLSVALTTAWADDAVPGTQLEQARPEQKTTLETVLVTATRLEKPLSEIARSIAVVGRDEIESIQPQSVAQVLAYQPNITVAGGPRAASQAVNVRGLQGSKILQTVDGARQGFESGHRPTYFLDPEMVRSVEAVRGPASSLWGSGAVGGVVAQNTITARDLLAEDASLGGFVKTGYNDNNEGSTSSAAVAGQAESLGWLLNGYYRDSDDLEMGNGDKLTGSGSHSYGGMGKLNWRLNENHALEAIYRHSDWDGSVPTNATAEVNETSNFLIEREQTSDNLNLAWHYDAGSNLVNLEALAFGSRVRMDETRKSDGRDDSTRLDTVGFNMTNLSSFGDARLMLGVDSYREDFSARRGGDSRPAPPEAKTTSWGTYALAEVPLADAWSVELGVRYDDFSTEADNLGESSGDSATSPSAAIVWSAADWLVLSARYDKAFRAPGAEELYSTGFHFCLFAGFCNSFAPNPDLQPEKAANTELNAKMAFADVAGADVIHLEASIFENEVDNFIEQVVVGPFFVPVMDPGFTTWYNVDNATLKGGELSAAYLRGGLSLKVSYGQVRGEDDSSGADLTNIPADTYKADLAYHFSGLNLMTGLRYTYAEAQNRTNYEENTSATTYDSYGVTDLYASWSPAALSAVRLELNVNNLEDKFYRQAWEQLDQAGREVIFSARFQF